MSKRAIRCCQTALMVVAVIVLGSGMALGQPNTCPAGAPAVTGDHTTGLPTTKTCPQNAAPGTTYNCTFQVTNADLNHCVENLVFTETSPIGQNPVDVDCFQPDPITGDPVAVTLLAWSGASGDADTCSGTITVSAPNNCGTTNIINRDRVDSLGTDRGDGTGTDQFFGLPADGGASGTTTVPPLVCTPSDDCHDATCSTETGCGNAPKADSTACVLEDNNACTTSGCEAGQCVATHVTSPCEPINDCNTAACNPTTGACDQTPVSDSTACVLEDNDSCTTSGCEAGQCVATHIEDPTCGVEICRTPGFWGTHGGIEKGGPNITQAVLNQTGPIEICGQLISTTDLTDDSAIEAICVSPKGNSLLQLARQLTAAALNCGLSNSTGCEGAGQVAGDVCSGVSIEDVFNACNAACEAGFTSPQSGEFAGISCIEAIDCFNNGGEGLDSEGVCQGNSGCHDRNLVNGCFNFPNPGPASSPKKCNDARKDDCTVLCAVDCSNTVPCP